MLAFLSVFRAEKSRGNIEDTTELPNGEISDIIALKKPKKQHIKVAMSCTTENISIPDSKQTESAKTNHRRSKTMPSTHVTRINKPLTVDPDRFMKTKIAADHAIRVSLC